MKICSCRLYLTAAFISLPRGCTNKPEPSAGYTATATAPSIFANTEIATDGAALPIGLAIASLRHS
jgi:hypothetical protein